MTIAEPGMFLVWAVLTAFAAVALGATLTVFIYERRINKVEQKNEALTSHNQYLYEKLIEQAQNPLPQLDAVAPLEETKKLRQKIAVSTVETGGWTPNQDVIEQARNNGDIPYFRVGMKIHVAGCPHLERAVAPQHLWAFTVDELAAMIEDSELHTCKTCKPLEEHVEVAVDEEPGEVPAEDGEEVDEPAEPGGAAAGRDEEHSVGDATDSDGTEDVRMPGALGATPVHADPGGDGDHEAGELADVAGDGLRGTGDEPGARGAATG